MTRCFANRFLAREFCVMVSRLLDHCRQVEYIMFGDASYTPSGCIVDHEMSCKSIMHSELTRQKVNWCALCRWQETQTHSTHGKTHFQTQNGPLSLTSPPVLAPFVENNWYLTIWWLISYLSGAREEDSGKAVGCRKLYGFFPDNLTVATQYALWVTDRVCSQRGYYNDAVS